MIGVGATTLPYDAMRRDVTVTANVTTPANDQENPLMLANALSPSIVDEEVRTVLVYVKNALYSAKFKQVKVYQFLFL